jgi:hypothetical protein
MCSSGLDRTCQDLQYDWLQVKVMLRPTVSVKHPFGPKITFLLLSYNCGFVDVVAPFSDERTDLSFTIGADHPPAQAFSGPSPPGLITILSDMQTTPPPPNWSARPPYLYPLETGGNTPQALVPFSSLLAICKTTVEVIEPASTRETGPLWLS